MQYLKIIKVILAMGALLFIAKPFIGFKELSCFRKPHSELILLKSFTKRKPEFLDESAKEKSAVHHKIANPPQPHTISIAALLCWLFPFMLISSETQKGFAVAKTHFLLPSKKAYLLTWKLII